jgi:predicted ABC-type sugar transport system permease subunit
VSLERQTLVDDGQALNENENMVLSVIIVLYGCIGFLSAAGSVFISKKLFSAKAEQIFFGLFFVAIAGFYLAFTAYFGEQGAWRLETGALIVFAVFGLLGLRFQLCSSSDICCMAFGMCFTRFMLMPAAVHSALAN